MFAGCFATFGLWFGLFCYLLSISPSTPVPSTGQIYPIADHGYYFYVSKTYSHLEDCLMDGFVLCFFGAGMLGAYWKIVPLPGSKPKKFY
jgi:hypothetical protein